MAQYADQKQATLDDIGNELPACSIVMPAYNVEAYVGEAVESVLTQTHANWRLIVVDDGSTDRTPAVVGEFHDERIRLIQAAHSGVCGARNRGVAEAEDDFLLFLDGDDRLRPDALSRLLGGLLANPDAGVAYGEAIIIDEAGHPVSSGGRPVFNRRPSGDVFRDIVRQNFIVLGTLCVRKVCLTEAGGFREDLRVAEDWECWCRIALNRDFVYVGGEPVLEYRHRAGSAIRKAGLDPSEALKSVEQVFGNLAAAERLGADREAFRRHSEASVYSFVANQRLRNRDWQAARACLLQSIRRAPGRPREWILYALAMLHWLPFAVERRLK